MSSQFHFQRKYTELEDFSKLQFKDVIPSMNTRCHTCTTVQHPICSQPFSLHQCYRSHWVKYTEVTAALWSETAIVKPTVVLITINWHSWLVWVSLDEEGGSRGRQLSQRSTDGRGLYRTTWVVWSIISCMLETARSDTAKPGQTYTVMYVQSVFYYLEYVFLWS